MSSDSSLNNALELIVSLFKAELISWISLI